MVNAGNVRLVKNLTLITNQDHVDYLELFALHRTRSTLLMEEHVNFANHTQELKITTNSVLLINVISMSSFVWMVVVNHA